MVFLLFSQGVERQELLSRYVEVATEIKQRTLHGLEAILKMPFQ